MNEERFERAMNVYTGKWQMLPLQGWSIDDLTDRPVIGIANTFNEICPGHMNLRQVCDAVKHGICLAGGVPVEFGTIAVCDIAQSGYVLPSRDVICDSIEQIETPDDSTVVFKLNQADSAIISKLTYQSLSILDSTVVKENGGTDAEDAASTDTAQEYLNSTSAGTGMYVMTSYIPNEQVVLEKNPNYWTESNNIEKYILNIQPDPNTQMMTLSTGDIDIAMNMTDDTMAELESSENIQIVNDATKMIGFVMMNMDETYGGPVSEPKVQQAIQMVLMSI